MTLNATRIYPSIASANPIKIADEMNKIKGYPYIHVDIEDGVFVPNITFGLKTVNAICSNSEFKYDVHLLVTNPKDYIDSLKYDSIFAISFHYEAVDYPLELLHQIRQMGKKAGLAINFKTKVENLEPYLEAVDYIIVMTAEPDGEGDLYREHSINRIKKLSQLINKTDVEIWVDGAMTKERISLCYLNGASKFVVGRTIWNADDPFLMLQELNQI